MGCLSLLCTFSSGCAFAQRCWSTSAESTVSKPSSTRGQVVLFRNLRYRSSHPGGLVYVWSRAATFVVALAVREPKQINAACAQLWFSLNAPSNHHLDSMTGVWKHSLHMVP